MFLYCTYIAYVLTTLQRCTRGQMIDILQRGRDEPKILPWPEGSKRMVWKE